MTGEIAAYAKSIRMRLDQIAGAVRDLPPDVLNAAPADGANSVAVLAVHATANACAWTLGIACGRTMRRDRPAEFATSGADGRALAVDITRAADEIDAALVVLEPARLDLRLIPPPDLWGEGSPREISVREALLQVVEHASLHLGHLQMTSETLQGEA